MNFSAELLFSTALQPTIVHRRARRGGFALVITLLILSLLIIVAVSYLSSMVSERQTADAYTSKARAEQIAQAGVDSATATLTESFKDFPDSATVWDVQQSQNGSGTVPYNEGTNLYLRAMSTTATLPGASAGTSTVVANPQPNAATSPANDINGNNPNNPACKTFVLPLISGVPGGRAQLLSAKSTMLPSMNTAETDPLKQNFTDLNVRRDSSDTTGVIGSPPDWPTTNGPKPARALWVNLKGNDGRLMGRYAFWMEDESFRTNVNYVNDVATAARADNTAQATNGSVARSVLPKDMFLAGTLAGFDAGASTADAQNVLDTRNVYPGHFLPDPLAFVHSATSATGADAFSATLSNGLRYLTTTQSGSLNLSRHGTQRLNLNATTTINATATVTMPEIRKLVEAIRFHLPNFGQRFYRLSNPDVAAASAKSTLLNRTTDVSTTNAEIYLYKTAANLRDYVDVDDQPTCIIAPQGGSTLPKLFVPGTTILHPYGSDGSGDDGPNYLWAQGKEGAPLLQEAVVRYRPAIQSSGANYTLSVDYYVEFWNMSDHDVKAADLGHNPFLRIGNQQQWVSTYIPATAGKPTSTGSVPQSGGALLNVSDGGTSPGTQGSGRDFNLDLINGVYCGDNPTNAVPISEGVVFKAGTATVITTDPDFVAYAGHAAPVSNSRWIYGGQPLGGSGIVNARVYYCSNATPTANARRTFSGPTGLVFKPGYLRGIMPIFRGVQNAGSTYLDFEVEATLANDLGYLDCVTGAFCISAGGGDASAYGSTNGYDFTWTTAGAEPHNDYLHGGTLAGNSTTVSEVGDPRTNGEQLAWKTFYGSSFPAEPDQGRYGSPGKNLVPAFSLGLPNSSYVQPATGTYPWPDYFNWPAAAIPYPPTAGLDATSAPAVIANSPLTSIGQLGDIFDPLRVIGTVGSFKIDNSRGGGRTLKIGQRDDRFTYDAGGNATNNAVSNVPVSNGWAAWRLTDVFGISDPLELPARVNINGVNRDGGAALRAALTGFTFQPTTTNDPLIHGTSNLASTELKTLSTDPTGVSQLVSQIKARLATPTTFNSNGVNTPWGPFFERGELGELENQDSTNSNSHNVPLFGKNVAVSSSTTSNDLTGKDLNHTFDRGREEVFRRLAELVCTRGDTFTVYTVGQSLLQTDVNKPTKITGTHRLRVTFRLVPKSIDPTTSAVKEFHPGYNTDPVSGAITGPTTIADPDSDLVGFNKRFAKPDRYDVQILEVNSF